MKKPFAFLLLLCCSLSMGAIERSEQIRQDLLNPNLDRVLVASHRADWRGWPENSLAAIESAIQIGVDIVELDLQLTADSQLIIMHDKTINRTTTGHGKISELTLDSIRHFRLKNGCSIQTTHPIPTLRDVLLLCKDRVLINLDKADRYFDLVMPILQETGTTRQIIMKGRKSADEVRQLYGKYLDEVIYMPVMSMDTPESVEAFQAHLTSHPCAFELCFVNDDQYVKQASALAQGKSLIWINTLWDTLCGGHEDDQAYLNPDAHYGYLIHTLGARIIQTDRPQFLIEYLHQSTPSQPSQPSKVQAYPGWITEMQPDSTEIEIKIIGDERMHYFINREGNKIEKNQQGWWVEISDTITH